LYVGCIPLVIQTGYIPIQPTKRQKAREKCWGALVGALDREMYEAETIGKIITTVMIALAHAEEE